MAVTIDRIKHSLSVAKKMKELAELNPDKFSANPDDVFILGILHDIGYEFTENQLEHGQKGGLILKEQGYKYWREVYYHGLTQSEFSSSELWLLNYADMLTGPTGEYVTMDERLEDIAERYGSDSPQKKGALRLVDKLKEQGYEG